MSDYRRAYVPAATYFFTLVTRDRRPWLGTDLGRFALRQAMRATRNRRPFDILGIVVLPDHLHAIWSLPHGDHDFSAQWKSIKQRCTNTMRRSGIGQRSLWQPRFWEHVIRDDEDLRRHLDYIHYNPVKHGFCAAPVEWGANSFHRYVREGIYPPDWGGPVEPIGIPE